MERLLEFQREDAKRTRVYDPASDFSYDDDVNNKWLSAEERALALKKQQEQRRLEEEQKKRRVITLDLVNKKVIHEPAANIPKPKEEENDIKPPRQPTPPADPRSTGQFRNPMLKIPAPVYVPVKPTKEVVPKKIPIQRRKAAEQEKGEGVREKEKVKEMIQRPRRQKGRWKPQLNRLQHDFGDGLSGEYEFDEYALEGGGAVGDEPECG